MKNIKLLIVAMVGIMAAGCYNDFDTPAPTKIYTEDEVKLLAGGLTHVSIADVKAKFGPISNTGTNNGWDRTLSLKFGEAAPGEENYPNISYWPEASKFYIKGKVISSDREGNVYKSLFIFDGTAAIELKLCGDLYLDYYLNLTSKESQWVYVLLDGLYLGNYRMMLSIGGAPSQSYNAAGNPKFYANSNIENKNRVLKFVLPGERVMLTEGTDPADDIYQVDASNYAQLGERYLGRLIRFNNIKVKYAGITYQDEVRNPDGSIKYDENGKVEWTPDIVCSNINNSPNSANPYPSWIVTDYGTPTFGVWYTLAFHNFKKNISLYGSMLISYLDTPTHTSESGVYSIRTSGFARFSTKPVPRNGTVGSVLGLYAIYSQQSDFSGQTSDWAQYQLTVSRYVDMAFPEDSLVPQYWIEHNTPATSYDPPVKNSNDDWVGGNE